MYQQALDHIFNTMHLDVGLGSLQGGLAVVQLLAGLSEGHLHSRLAGAREAAKVAAAEA